MHVCRLHNGEEFSVASSILPHMCLDRLVLLLGCGTVYMMELTVPSDLETLSDQQVLSFLLYPLILFVHHQ